MDARNQKPIPYHMLVNAGVECMVKVEFRNKLNNYKESPFQLEQLQLASDALTACAKLAEFFYDKSHSMFMTDCSISYNNREVELNDRKMKNHFICFYCPNKC